MPKDRTCTIVVVDDDADLRDLTGEVLRRAGFEVREAATGAEALSIAGQGVDLVILDVHLPDIDGFEVCRRLKEDGRTAAIPVLHLSGVYREVEYRVKGLGSGGDAYLVRPVESAELLATVRTLLRLRRVEGDLRESESRRRTAEALAKIGRLLAESAGPDEVGQVIVHSVREHLRAHHAILYRLDAESGELVAVAVSGGIEPALHRGMVLPADMGVAGLAVRERRPVVTLDLLADPRVRLTPDLQARAERYGFRVVLGVPLCVRERVIGVLTAGDQAGRRFDEEELRLVQTFTDQAALALENARLLAETTERLKETETLLAVGRVLVLALPTQETMRRLAWEVARACAADMVGAYFLDAGKEALLPVAGYHGLPHLRETLAQTAFPIARFSLLREAWKTGKPVSTADYQHDPRCDQEFLAPHRPRSLLFAPAQIRGEIIGGLLLGWWADAHTPSSGELRMIEAITSQLGLALERSQAEEALRESEARYQTLAQVAPVGIFRTDADGRCLYVNRRWCEIAGLGPDDANGDAWAQGLHPDSRRVAGYRARHAGPGVRRRRASRPCPGEDDPRRGR